MNRKRLCIVAVLVAALCACLLFACAPKTLPTEMFTVTFNANSGVFSDGSGISTQTVESGNKATAPAVSRDGFDFTGWHTDLAATVKVDLSTVVITSDITYYAGWSKKTDDTDTPPADEEPTLTGITVNPPTKTQYVVGQTVSFAGLAVTATFSDGSTQVVTSGYTVSPEAANVDTSIKGTKTVTVSYQGQTATFDITVIEKAVIALSHTGVLTADFGVGDSFNLATATGLIFSVAYNDGSSSPVVSGVTFESAALDAQGKFTTPGLATIVAKYGVISDSQALQVEVADITKYDVVFNANVPTYVDSASVKDMPTARRLAEGSTVSAPAVAPKVTGYTFDKWTTDPAGNTPFAFGSTPVTGRLDLYAQWNAKTYNIVYYLNDGSYADGESNPAVYTATANVFEPITLKSIGKAHYTFDGWFTKETNGARRTQISYADILAATGNTINLYAYFTPETYTIEYTFGGSATTYLAEKKVTTAVCWKASYTYGDSFDLPVEGDIKITAKDTNTYHFLGWYLSGDANETRVTKVRPSDFGNKTFVANIKAVNVYTITVHPENGENTSSVKVQEDSAIGTLEEPHRLGYRFGGWYTSTDYAVGEEWNIATTPVTDNDDIYAKWDVNTYNISYDLTALSGATNHADNPATYQITAGEVTLEDPQNLAAGYYFVGWFTQATGGTRVQKINGAFITNKEHGSTTTLYARFDNKYGVVFNQNSGTDSVTDMPDDLTDVTYNSELDSVRDPVRTNYTFGGWYTSDTDFSEANRWVFKGESGAVSKLTSDVTLYAKWTENADDGWYLLKNGMTAADLTAANCAQYKMTVGETVTASGVSFAVGDTFTIITYQKSNASFTAKRLSAVTSVPVGAITITRSNDVYTVTAIDDSLASPVTFTLSADANRSALTVTYDGYNNKRGTDGNAAELTVETVKANTAYVVGNFTGNAFTAEWSSAGVAKFGDVIYFQNIGLRKFDKFNINYNSAVSEVRTISAAGVYNISYNVATNAVTVNEYKTLTASKKTGEENNVYVGQSIGANKITVMYDGSEIAMANQSAPDGYVLLTSAATSNAEGASSFTVIYKGSTATVTYTAVAVEVVGIEAELAQSYLDADYYYGDDVQGLKSSIALKLVYNDGHRTAFSGEYTLALVVGTAPTGDGVKPTDKLVGGRLTITATAEQKSLSTTIELPNTYNKLVSVGAEFTGGTFKQDDRFTLGDNNENLTVTAYFNTGTSLYMVLNSSEYTLDPAVGTKLALPASGNTRAVTVTVENAFTQAGGVSCTFDITVNAKTLQKVSVTGSLAKTQYFVGDGFSANGITVEATYDNTDDNVVDVTANAEFTASYLVSDVFTKAGDYTISVSFGGMTAVAADIENALEVSVSDVLTSISVTVPVGTHEVGFVAGDDTPTVTTVTRKYNEDIEGAAEQPTDSTSEGVTYVIKKNGVEVDKTAKLSAGKYDYTVTCGGKSFEFSITVVAKAVTSISADTSALANQYTNAPFNSDGLVIRVEYNNDTNDTIPLSEYTFTATYNDGGGFPSAGQKQITATHKTDSTKSLKFNVTVLEQSRYSVTFNAQNGTYAVSGTPVTQTVDSESVIEKPADPVCKGFTLEGWYWTKNGVETKWIFDGDGDEPTQVLGNRTLVAHWTAKKYNINYFDADDSAVAVGNKFEATDNVFGELTLKTLSECTGLNTPAHKVFAGWAFTKTATDGITTFTYENLPQADTATAITLYPVFVYEKFDVTFDSNGGSSVAGDEVEYGGKIEKPADPTRDYYTFDGWYKEATYQTAWSFTTDTVEGAVTLYAKWTAKVYTIKFTVDTATAEAVADAKVAAEVVDGAVAISAFSLPTPIVKSGIDKRFAGWKLNGATVTAITLADFGEGTQITLVAEFTDVEYVTVTFDYNYTGAPNAATVRVEKGTAITADQLNSVAPANRTGFSFVDWYEETSGDTLWNHGDALTGNITVYAKWSDVKYTVTFNATKPTGATATVKNPPASEEVAEGGKVTKPTTDPSLTGYTFDGWYKEAACTTPWNFDVDTITAVTTIYAKWTARDGIYVGDAFKKAFKDVTANDEVVAEFVQLAEGEAFNAYRGGAMVTMTQLKTGPGSAADNFTISDDKKTVTVKAGNGGVYHISLNYNSNKGLWIVYQGEKFEEADLKDGDGVYVNGSFKVGFTVNADGMNEVQAKHVEIGNGADDATQYTVTFKYGGNNAPIALTTVTNGSGAGEGITVTFTSTSVKLYAGTYDFYYMFESTASSAKNKLWINGEQIGGPIAPYAAAVVDGKEYKMTVNDNTDADVKNEYTVSITGLAKGKAIAFKYDGTELKIGLDSYCKGLDIRNKTNQTSVSTGIAGDFVFYLKEFTDGSWGVYGQITSLTIPDDTKALCFTDGSVIMIKFEMPVWSGSVNSNYRVNIWGGSSAVGVHDESMISVMDTLANMKLSENNGIQTVFHEKKTGEESDKWSVNFINKITAMNKLYTVSLSGTWDNGNYNVNVVPADL